MSERVTKSHIGIGGSVTGEALVAQDNFSARYDLDRINGTFRARATRSSARAVMAKSWFSISRRAASPRRGCCGR